MKTRNFLLMAGIILLSALCLGGLASCDTDDWDPAPPPGWETFYDNRLEGTWELVEANGQPVRGTAVNYLDFYGNGNGRYFYYNNGMQSSERMNYWCQVSTNNASRYQMNMKYQYSSPSTVNYWFTDARNYLWMQWGTGSGVITYAYRSVPGPGW